MLYLRTGSNGACKSLFTLKDVREKQLAELRPVCIIVGDAENPTREYVKIKPEVMAQFGWTTCQFKDWWAQPDGTIFLADECHNYLPKRPNGSAVPQQVARLAEHRARGFDFYLLTQHGSNIDAFVTKLIGAPGWHQHLKRVAGGSAVTSVLQFDAYNSTAEKAGSGKSGQITMRAQPKEVYDWYNSAELHTAKLRIPRAVWWVVLGVPLGFGCIGGAIYLLYNRTVGKAQAAAVASGAPGQAPGAPGVGGPGRERPKTAAEYVADYRPRIAGLMHSAPVYDKLTEPKRVPVPAACVSMPSKGCKCFTQDATPYPMDEAMCRGMVEHGTFYAFQAEGERAGQHQAASGGAASPQATAEARSEPIVIASLPQSLPAAPVPAPGAPQPQRIASVKR